jgi:hypothetical protein
MRPRFAVDYSVDNLMANPVFAGQFGADLASRVSLTNVANHIFGQFCIDIIRSKMNAASGAPLERTIPHIVNLISWSQVFGIYASRIVAFMKNVHARGNWPIVQFVGKAMRPIGPLSCGESAISSILLGSLPFPTIVWAALIDFFPETICGQARAKMMKANESSLLGREFRNGNGLTTSTFTEFWSIMGLHKNLHFLCQAWDVSSVARHFLLGYYRSILA